MTKHKKSRFLRCAALAALSTGLMLAQPAGFTPPTPADQATRMVAHLTKILDLTSTQQTAATTIFTTEFTTLSGLHPARKTAQTDLKTAVAGNNLIGIETAAATLGDLEKQQVTAQGTADAAFYLLLNSTQQTKYTSLHMDGFGGGPGGFGGRGPGPRH